MSRKPWETPISYNDDRWREPKAAEHLAAAAAAGKPLFPDDDIEARDASDVEELLRRPDRQGDREYECNDTTPIDYAKGPHDEEFGVDEKEFDGGAENPPVDYGSGPHDDEFGLDDEGDLEPAGPDEGFPEDV
jgi:hypothetical protein